jgi:6-pyruvoyltetrahydropterin/6-carboxytetrahydropterin synthase
LRLRVEQSFDAATALPGHDRCDVLHGHTYRAEMTVEGQEKDGLLIDFTRLKEVLRKACDRYDHRDLSKQFPYPSCESICLELAKSLKAEVSPFKSLKIWEGEGKWVEVEVGEV